MSFALGAACGPLLFAAVTGRAAEPVTGGFAIDTHDREAVRNFYNAVFAERADVRADWTGSVAQCLAGTTSPAYRDAVLTRLNFYRALAGVPASVTFRADYSLRAQEAALIMSANDEISHTPVEGWLCFSAPGAEGADNSNLALGNAGIDAIEAYVMDAGPNHRAGHRRWLIYPKTQAMGTGDIDPPDGSEEQKANALWLFDDHFLDPRPATRESFVAWPPPGHVPNRLVYPRWSFHISGADFTNSVVTMTSNGAPVSVWKEKVEFGYGENGVVFVPHGIAPQARLYWPKPAEDIAYTVSIGNIVTRTGAVTNYSYNVVVFDPERPLGASASVRVAGPAQPAARRVSSYEFPEVAGASGYDFRLARLEPFTRVEGAEETNPAVVSLSSGLYPLTQTNLAAAGAAAFHLAHSKPPRPQWMMPAGTLVPSAESELVFQSRLGGATVEQVARVQVSLDEGSSWRDLWEQAGRGTPSDTQNPGETEFAERRVALAPFAGRAIWIRFNYGFVFGPAAFARGAEPGVGWYIDEIQVTHAQELAGAAILSGATPRLDLVPPEPGGYYLDARPRFYGEYRGEWSWGARLEALEPEPTSVTIGSLRETGARLEIFFQARSLPPNARFRVESLSRLGGGWTAENAAEISELNAGWKAALDRSPGPAGFYRIVVE